jgi:hypothetical protein
MPFLSRIRDRGVSPQQHLVLELGLCLGIVRRTEGVDRAGAGLTLALALLDYDSGCTDWRGRAGSAGLIPK